MEFIKEAIEEFKRANKTFTSSEAYTLAEAVKKIFTGPAGNAATADITQPFHRVIFANLEQLCQYLTFLRAGALCSQPFNESNYLQDGAAGWTTLMRTVWELAPDRVFEEAFEMSKKINKTLSDDEEKEVDALHNQATVGDVTGAKPSLFDIKGRAKWNAWKAKKGVDTKKAKQDYVDFVNKLADKHGCQ